MRKRIYKRKEKERNKRKDFLKEMGSTIIISIMISFLILDFFSIVVVDGHSMDSTLSDNEKLILFEKSYFLKKNPEKGDIVVIKKKVTDGDYIIKRVIGKEGDTIKIQRNKVYINNKIIDEPYINEPMNKDENINITIPEGYIFVMGDNRNNSLDSRSEKIGLVNIETEVVGKAIFSLSSFSGIE